MLSANFFNMWKYNTTNCYKCGNDLKNNYEFSIPFEKNDNNNNNNNNNYTNLYPKFNMNITVCKKCYRNWKLNLIGI